MGGGAKNNVQLQPIITLHWYKCTQIRLFYFWNSINFLWYGKSYFFRIIHFNYYILYDMWYKLWWKCLRWFTIDLFLQLSLKRRLHLFCLFCSIILIILIVFNFDFPSATPTPLVWSLLYVLPFEHVISNKYVREGVKKKY